MNSNPELRSAGVSVQRVARGGKFPPPGGANCVLPAHARLWIRISMDPHSSTKNECGSTALVERYRAGVLVPYLYITRPDKSEAGVTTLPTYRYDNDRDLYRYLFTYTYRWVLGYVYVQMVIT